MESIHSKLDFSGRLIIVADDLGLDQSVNDGIFSLSHQSAIDWASLMPNGTAFEHAVAGIKNNPGLKIGVHFVLIEEKGILPREEISSLLNDKGFLHASHRSFFIRYILGFIKQDEIQKELEAQIQKVLKTGIRPKFLNSHQHLHLLPGITDIVISLAHRHGISYVRIVSEPLEIPGNFFRKIQLSFLRVLSSLARRKIIASGLACNDVFVGFLHAGSLSRLDIDYACYLRQKYPSKIIELGCHPGFENSLLREKYKSWGYHWQGEMKVLTSSQ